MKKAFVYNVAAYIRLSSEDGDKTESDSVSNQRTLLLDYLVGKEDLVFYDTYIDDGYTGTNFRRPAFQKMLRDMDAGLVNCVLVKDMSRFGRDYIETGRYIEREFPERNIRFISILDRYDNLTDQYSILMPIKNIFNEQYAKDISDKIHASIKAKQRAGEFIGAFPSYGYQKSPEDKSKLIIDEYAADVVRQIYRMYLDGISKQGIASRLNSEGIVCPSEYKRLKGSNYKNSNKLETTTYWVISSVNKILKNEMYIGNMVQGTRTQQMRKRQHHVDKDEWIVVRGTHEAIIDMEDWNKVQDLLKRRTRAMNLDGNVSIFAGFLKCGDCGRAMVKKTGTPGHGAGITNYYCGTYVRGGRVFCSKHAIPHAVLEKIILEDLNTIIRNLSDLKSLIKKNKLTMPAQTKSTEEQLSTLHSQLSKVQKRKKSIYEDYLENLISKEEYITYRQDYMKQEELLLKQISALSELQEAPREEDIFSLPWIKHLLELNAIESLTRDIIAEMIQEIKIYENHKIKIIYKFSDEMKELFSTTIPCE